MSAVAGQSVQFDCGIRNLGDRYVSNFIKSKDCYGCQLSVWRLLDQPDVGILIHLKKGIRTSEKCEKGDFFLIFFNLLLLSLSGLWNIWGIFSFAFFPEFEQCQKNCLKKLIPQGCHVILESGVDERHIFEGAKVETLNYFFSTWSRQKKRSFRAMHHLFFFLLCKSISISRPCLFSLFLQDWNKKKFFSSCLEELWQ